jgi:hypothetical protein
MFVETLIKIMKNVFQHEKFPFQKSKLKSKPFGVSIFQIEKLVFECSFKKI